MTDFNKENLTTLADDLQETLEAYRLDADRASFLPLQVGSSLATKAVGFSLLDIMTKLLRHHRHGNWGQIPPEEEIANERALREGGEICSVYIMDEDLIIVCTTTADRSATTFSLPEEI
ncbi:MAG: hypothetical protein EON58_07870 [Alphaproteobacteria bacterium]|nr:MAG: hypothetical protein EON58_07870 [Alphaproteobacteria bacterium]